MKIKQKIPNGWSIEKLGEICDVRDGTHDTPKFLDTGYPLITSKNLINGKIDFNNIQYISKEDHINICKRSYVDDGDILLAMIGTIGNPVLVKKDRDFSIKNVALFKVGKSSKINNIYLYNCLLFLNKELNKKSAGGIQKFIGLSIFRNFQILIPPLAEQEKIVSILSKQDEVIEKLEDLIELKVKQKKGLMQKLLSGKVRLPKILPLFEGEMYEGQRGSFFEGSESAKLSTPPSGKPDTSPQSREGLESHHSLMGSTKPKLCKFTCNN